MCRPVVIPPGSGIKECRRLSQQFLIGKGFSSSEAALDSDVLLMHCSGLERHQLFTYSTPLEEATLLNLQHALLRRSAREPVAYIIGEKEFYSRPFIVTADVLIPRPESEWLVARAVRIVQSREFNTIIDVGTGSGVLIISIALELQQPGLQTFIASDVSDAALRIADRNSRQLGADNLISFRHGSLLEPYGDEDLQQPVLIVANLPYIPANIELMPDVGDFEPHSALFAGESGLDLIESFLLQCRSRLADGSLLLLEHDTSQVASLATIARQPGFDSIAFHNDDTGRPRFMEIAV